VADTTYMKNVVEPWVRTWLAQQFPGHRFSKQFLELNANFQSVPGKHEFDAVSEDKSIVAAIKGHSWKTSGGNLPSGKYAQLYQELYFLSLVKATQKFLILTHEEMYNDFQKRSQGKIAEGIRILFCELPREVEEKVASMQVRASKEQKPQ